MRDTVFTRHSVRLAEVDGEIVGFASRDGTWLMNLYVKPGWTGHGIGTQLLRAMLANAASATPTLRVCTFARNEHARVASSRIAASGRSDPATASANEEHEPDLRYERPTRVTLNVRATQRERLSGFPVRRFRFRGGATPCA